jgi:hypothetical protein
MKEKALSCSSPRRRILWNDDGDDLRAVAFGCGQIWTARGMVPVVDRFESIGQFLDLRLSAIAETPVDVISYCGVFTWPVWDFPRERLTALGEDPLLPVVDFAHRHGKEFFFNLRMNDAHTSGPHWQGAAYWEPFRLKHRGCLQARIDDDTWERAYLPWARGESTSYPLQDVLARHGSHCRELLSWATYDYARSEVRDYFLDLIQQACERYDLDGIDLDWLRAPYFFRVGEERRHVPLMNDFVRRAAAVIRATAEKRGRPISLCMRVPDSPRRALELGLDVAHWIREGWLDLLVAGNGLAVFSMPFSPWRELCAPAGIPVLACLSRSASTLAEPEAFFGACLRLWTQKVDGLYFFNHFIPEEYSTICRGSDLKQLAKETKIYALDTQHSAFENGTVYEGPVPMAFEGGGESAETFEIEVPETVKDGTNVRLKTTWRAPFDGSGAHWALNGNPLPRSNAEGVSSPEYTVTELRKGANRIHLNLSLEAMTKATRVTLEAVSLRVSAGEAG